MTERYALTNPLVLVLDKSCEQFNREDMIRVILEKQIERITFHYTALDGKFKELKIPISNRYQAERTLAEGERVDGSSLFKGLVDTGLSDLYVVPRYKSAFLNPFDPGSLDFVCRYLLPDGSFAPFGLDNILHRATKLLKKNHDLELHALGELEFYLFSEPTSRIYQASRQRGYHASAPFVKSGEIVNEMVRHITQITGAVKYAHSEVGYVESVSSDSDEIKGKQAEQLEIEFLPTPILDLGDHLVMARWLIRNVAYKYGCVATFAPKIDEGIAGSGLHVHIQLMKNGKNIMRNDSGNLSDPSKRVIGGLCTYADSLTAFGNTVASSYLRLVPNQEAPTRICWSDMNRSVMIRVPLGWTKMNNLSQVLNPPEKTQFQEVTGRQTVELRSPDGSALIHLLLAGITLAVEWGLSDPKAPELTEKLYVKGNIFQDEKLLKKLPSLPKSCVESSRILVQKREYYERENIFPASVIDYMASLLKAENDENMSHFLTGLPEDERLLEMRKIMHKDLHRH